MVRVCVWLSEKEWTGANIRGKEQTIFFLLSLHFRIYTSFPENKEG